jgi:hypothetical protein
MPTSDFDYTHGDSGNKPPDGHDAQSGNSADPEYYDWYVNQFITKINGLVGDINDILNGNLTVGEASNTQTVKGNDIDSNGDGVVDNADKASNTTNVKGNDIDSNGDGKVDNADKADTATKVKGNDIDSDGDGRVDAADHATNANDADTVDGSNVFVQSGSPSNPSSGDIWLDTS